VAWGVREIEDLRPAKQAGPAMLNGDQLDRLVERIVEELAGKLKL